MPTVVVLPFVPVTRDEPQLRAPARRSAAAAAIGGGAARVAHDERGKRRARRHPRRSRRRRRRAPPRGRNSWPSRSEPRTARKSPPAATVRLSSVMPVNVVRQRARTSRRAARRARARRGCASSGTASWLRVETHERARAERACPLPARSSPVAPAVELHAESRAVQRVHRLAQREAAHVGNRPRLRRAARRARRWRAHDERRARVLSGIASESRAAPHRGAGCHRDLARLRRIGAGFAAAVLRRERPARCGAA